MPAVLSPGFSLLDNDPGSLSEFLADALVTQTGNVLLVSTLGFNSSADLRLRLFSPTGVGTGPAQTVNTTTFGSQADAKVTQLANGNIVVVWTDASETAPDFFGNAVRMQVYDANGTKIGGEVTVPTMTDGDQQVETVVALSNGRYAVVWDDFSQSSFAQMKFRIFNADGTAASAEVPILGVFSEDREGFVAADANGGLVVSALNSSGGNSVLLQRYNADGSTNGSAIVVVGPQFGLSDTKVAVLANGTYVVSWTDSTNTPPFNKGPIVYAQVVDAAGNTVGDAFTVSDDIFSEHDRSEITALDSGKFAVTWRMSPDNDFLGYKIVTRIFNADGSPDSDVTIVYDNAVNNGNIRNFASLQAVSEMPDGRLLYIFNALVPDGSTITATRIVDPRDAQNVTLTNTAEEYTGTIFGDVIRGQAGNDTLLGEAGNDVLLGGTGADVLNGGAGTRDRVQYTDATAGVRVDLQVPSTNTGIAAGDTFIGVEDIYGSFHGDTLLGDTANNIIWGELGNDAWLDGRIGNDTVYGGAGNDVLIGGWGADSLDGGAGARDRVQYTDSATGIRVDIQVATFNTGVAAGDIYTGVEDIYGSFQGDTLLGDAGGNIIWGAAGNDQIDGRLGNDTLIGGAGNDTLTGGSGVDVFLFETALGATNRDSITGYTVADDTIQLENAIFTALTATGTLAATAFVNGAAATTAAHRIIYNSANGQLLYDADGNGAGAAVLFATLTPGLAITEAEFLVV